MKRLDRFLSEAGVASRRKIKDVIRSGRVGVNGVTVTAPEHLLGPTDTVTLDGAVIAGEERRIVLMLHKPAGCVTAAKDADHPTVMEYLPPQYRGLMPIGRLDMQTEGLLLFTNDGALAHRLISPRHGIEKVYYAEHAGVIDEADIAAFADGCVLRDGTVCRPAVLEPLGAGKCLVRVCEGKYHQVRRMLASRGKPVSYLRRIAEGKVELGDLPVGITRELSEHEVELLESVNFDEKFPHGI